MLEFRAAYYLKKYVYVNGNNISFEKNVKYKRKNNRLKSLVCCLLLLLLTFFTFLLGI